jgi:DNA-binding transcriptional MerR regulator
MEKTLPAIPAKRYFTIGEVSDLCGVKPYVLRYWEQEFTQLKPMKRRGNRRYYQHHEVLLIRRIRELLYEQGFTISGARNRLTDGAQRREAAAHGQPSLLSPDGVDGHDGHDSHDGDDVDGAPGGPGHEALPPAHDRRRSSYAGQSGRSNQDAVDAGQPLPPFPDEDRFPLSPAQVRQELLSIRGLLAS